MNCASVVVVTVDGGVVSFFVDELVEVLRVVVGVGMVVDTRAELDLINIVFPYHALHILQSS